MLPISEQTEIGSPAGSMVIDQGSFTTSTTNYYTMKMWVDEKTEITDTVKFYTITVNVYAKDEAPLQYTDEKYFIFYHCEGIECDYVEKGMIIDYDAENGPKNVVIPSTINGYTVSHINQNAFKGKDLTKVVIPDTVKYISPGAFNDNQFSDKDAFIYQ